MLKLILVVSIISSFLNALEFKKTSSLSLMEARGLDSVNEGRLLSKEEFDKEYQIYMDSKVRDQIKKESLKIAKKKNNANQILEYKNLSELKQKELDYSNAEQIFALHKVKEEKKQLLKQQHLQRKKAEDTRRKKHNYLRNLLMKGRLSYATLRKPTFLEKYQQLSLKSFIKIYLRKFKSLTKEEKHLALKSILSTSKLIEELEYNILVQKIKTDVSKLHRLNKDFPLETSKLKIKYPFELYTPEEKRQIRINKIKYAKAM